MIPPKNKLSSRAAKRGKAVRKSARVVQSDFDSDGASGSDEPSVKDVLKNLSPMMATLSTRMDDMEGDGRRKRRVALRGRVTPGGDAATAAAGPSTANPPAPTEFSATAPPALRPQDDATTISRLFSRKGAAPLPPLEADVYGQSADTTVGTFTLPEVTDWPSACDLPPRLYCCLRKKVPAMRRITCTDKNGVQKVVNYGLWTRTFLCK